MELFARPQRLRGFLAGVAVFLLFAAPSQAQFRFNFSASGGAVVPGIANQTCGGAGGMGGGGACDGTPFVQEVINVGGSEYYHVIIGNGSGEFGLEYYMRTSGLCWYGCPNARVTGGMGGGGMGGGGTPLSSSSGPATNDSSPLSNASAGVGAPNRVALRQFNNTSVMSQEFLKTTETQKPKITQTINDPGMTMNFSVDMSNSNYSQMNATATVALTQSVAGTGAPAPGTNPATGKPFPSSENFNIDDIGPTAVRENTAGRFTYTPGGGDGGSMGTYQYFADTYDVYNINWQSFCQPAQNPASNCTNYGGVRGGMGGGAGGGMGAGAVAAAAPTPPTAAANAAGNTGGASGGGSLGGGAVNATNTTPTATASTALPIRALIGLPTIASVQPAGAAPADPFTSANANASASSAAVTSSTQRRSSTTRSSVTTSTVTTRFVR